MYADANVHSLDGYTCQGTPSLMDGPQIKPCTCHHWGSPLGTLNSLRQLRQLPLPTTATTAYDSLRQLTHVITATTATTAYDSLRQPSDNDSYDSIRQMYDSLRQLRQLRQPGLRVQLEGVQQQQQQKGPRTT